MTNGSAISKGGAPITGQDRKQPGRHYAVLANGFPQAATGEPIPVFWGSVRRAGSYLSPIFKLRGVKITTKVGK